MEVLPNMCISADWPCQDGQGQHLLIAPLDANAVDGILGSFLCHVPLLAIVSSTSMCQTMARGT